VELETEIGISLVYVIFNWVYPIQSVLWPWYWFSGFYTWKHCFSAS